MSQGSTNISPVKAKNNYVLVKVLTDFPTPVANIISLVANTTYEINGAIVLAGNQIRVANNVSIIGGNKYVDSLTATHALPMFIDSGVNCDFIIKFLTITNTTASSSVFLFTGIGNSDIQFNQFKSCTSLGSITNNASVDFLNNTIVNCSGGLTTNTISNLFIKDNYFEVNLSTYTAITIGATVFQTIVISRNHIEAATGQTCLNISTSATVTVGHLLGNILEGVGTMLSGINCTQANWTFGSNSNIGNVVRQLDLVTPASVTSGTAFVISITANDRLIRTLNGNNVSNTSYQEIAIPADFVSWTTNSISVDTRKDHANCNFTLTAGKAGVVDATVNAISLIATALNTWETKTTTLTAAGYAAGDRILFTLVSSTGTGTRTTDLGQLKIKFIAK